MSGLNLRLVIGWDTRVVAKLSKVRLEGLAASLKLLLDAGKNTVLGKEGRSVFHIPITNYYIPGNPSQLSTTLTSTRYSR